MYEFIVCRNTEIVILLFCCVVTLEIKNCVFQAFQSYILIISTLSV